jgi:glycosyltransferase involved in cell wall biosynthesis
MERIFLQHADHIISLTHRGVEVMQGWQHARLDIKKVSVIPCCVDTDLFDATRIDPVQKDKLAIELSIQAGDVILSYLGSIGTWYMLEEMLDFFCFFKKQFPLSRFLFITHDEHEHIINTALIKGLSKNDLILRGAARSEVPALLSLTSYSLFFIRPTYSKAASSPTKQGELMAMGMPVICNAGVGDTDIIVNKFHSGVLVEQFTDDDYERAIKAITSSVFNAGGIRAGALDYFALEKGVSKYQEIYKKLLSS